MAFTNLFLSYTISSNHRSVLLHECGRLGLFVPSVIDSSNVRPNTKAKMKDKSYPNYIHKAMARKQRLWRIYHKNPINALIYESYRKAESKFRTLIFKLEVKMKMP